MNSMKDRIRGTFNQGAGRLKQGLSHDTHDPGVNAEGTGQELKGTGQKIMGNMKDMARHARDGVKQIFKKTG